MDKVSVIVKFDIKNEKTFENVISCTISNDNRFLCINYEDAINVGMGKYLMSTNSIVIKIDNILSYEIIKIEGGK